MIQHGSPRGTVAHGAPISKKGGRAGTCNKIKSNADVEVKKQQSQLYNYFKTRSKELQSQLIHFKITRYRIQNQ